LQFVTFYCITRKTICTGVNHVKTKTNLLKPRLLIEADAKQALPRSQQSGSDAKQALPRSQQSGYCITYLRVKSERCQQRSMLSAVLINIKCFE